MDKTQALLGLSMALFSLGLLGVIVRRNLLVMLMCMELMLNGVILSLVSFAQQLNDTAGAVLVFLIFIVATAEIALAMNSKSYKEAQSVLSIFALVPLLPGLAVSMMELETNTWMYAVPMLSNQTLLRELAKGQEMGMLPFAMTFLSSLLPALAVIGVGSVLTAPLGARIAHRVPVAQLKRVFALLLYCLAGYMLYKGLAS